MDDLLGFVTIEKVRSYLKRARETLAGLFITPDAGKETLVCFDRYVTDFIEPLLASGNTQRNLQALREVRELVGATMAAISDAMKKVN